MSTALSQDKIFLHCFIQGLTHILIAKHEALQRDDPVVFTQMCKLILKKHFKSSLSLASPLILADLVMLT